MPASAIAESHASVTVPGLASEVNSIARGR